MKIACIQLSSTKNYIRNINDIINYVNQAIKNKSDLIITPETSSIMTDNKSDLFKFSYEMKKDPLIKKLSFISKSKKKWILIGSLSIKVGSKLRNRSILLGPNGKVVKYYDKINMFDVRVSKKEKHYESNIYKAGNKLVSTKLPWGNLGFSICYDLRFPNLFRQLAKKGAQIILMPAAFTVPSGKAHWEIMLRSRAIENSFFVVATDMCGTHHTNRKTYGHSILVNPWGEIIAKAKSRPKILNSKINLDEIKNVRNKIPAILHD